MHSVCAIAGIAALAVLAGCGGDRSAESAPTDAGADETPAAVSEDSPDTADLCANFDRVLAARSDTPAFASLPDGFRLGPGVSCVTGQRDIVLISGGASVPVTFDGYICTYLDAAGTIEATGWEHWTGVLEDVSTCFTNGWDVSAETEVTEAGPVRRTLMRRAPDFDTVSRPEGDAWPVRFEWTQDGGQKITFFVIAP